MENIGCSNVASMACRVTAGLCQLYRHPTAYAVAYAAYKIHNVPSINPILLNVVSLDAAPGTTQHVTETPDYRTRCYRFYTVSMKVAVTETDIALP